MASSAKWSCSTRSGSSSLEEAAKVEKVVSKPIFARVVGELQTSQASTRVSTQSPRACLAYHSTVASLDFSIPTCNEWAE